MRHFEMIAMSSRARAFHYAAFGLSCIYALLLFCQLNTRTEAFPSDLRLHVEFVLHPDQSTAAGYSLLHVLCGRVLAWSGLQGPKALLFVSGTMLVLLVATFYGSLLAVHAFLKGYYPRSKLWLLAGCTLAAFLVSMIVLRPLLPGVLYLGVFTPNPWHNPTYIFGRFFSILAFGQFVRLLGSDTKTTLGQLAALAAFAALSVWGKPSFLIAFLPAALAVLGWGWWRRWLEPGPVLRLAAAFAPAVLMLAWVDHKVFASAGTVAKVAFAPGQGWGIYTPSFTMSIALGMAFPLYVLVVKLPDISRLMLTASATWFASCTSFLLLAETGARATHANFAWCYMSGMFFMHLGAMGEWFLGTPVCNRTLRWIGTALFLLHLFSGLRYFLHILDGASYI